MAVSLDEAIAAARRTCPGDQWLLMTPREQTQLIYQEMRRLDCERAGAVPELAEATAQPAPSRVAPGPLTCVAVVRTRSSGRCAWRATVVRNGRPYCGFHARREDAQVERRAEAVAAD